LHGDAEYADVVERALYNGVLAGIGMDGKSFFYVNPLDSTGGHHRQPFFDCACCPTNVVRFVPSLPGYQYAVEGNTVYVNQFVAGTATLQLQDGELTITQKTNYPWDGKVMCEITNTPKGNAERTFEVVMRNPGWAMTPPGAGVYAGSLSTSWNQTNTGWLGKDFIMKPTRMIAHPNVTADRGRVAIQRGPLVYCFEQCDNDVPIAQIKLAREPEFTEEFRKDLLGGMVVLKCKNADGRELTAIPYYAWDHREPGAMAVWVRQEGLSRQQLLNTKDNNLYAVLTPEMLRPDSELEDETEDEVSASYCYGTDSLESVIAGNKPKNSNDHDIPRMTFWNHKGTKEWIALDFGKAKKVSQCSVYWFDDTGRGECRVPKSWTLSYRSGEQWILVKTSDALGVARDRYNTVKFEPVETTGLRLDIQLQENVSGGVLDWKYE
jgi:hypothetical protein